MPIARETSTFEPAPAGTHIARCYGCIDLGTQASELFGGAFHKIMLMWELPFERTKGSDSNTGDKPMVISKEYTLSLNKKSNLRKTLDTWRGRPFTPTELQGFEVADVIGAACQLTIAHVQSAKGETYARVEAVTGLAKGMTCPQQEHPSIRYEIDSGRNEAFQSLPEWIRKKIEQCEEWRPAPEPTPACPEDSGDPNAPAQAQTPVEDDVPF